MTARTGKKGTGDRRRFGPAERGGWGAGIGWLVAITAALAPPALAETRIVSLKSDRPGIGIAAVASDGRTLRTVGQAGTSLFVEAGSADAPFVCRQTLAITLSDGRGLTRAYDLCALGYMVEVETAAATAAPPATASAARSAPQAQAASPTASAPAAAGSGAGRVERKLVMIQTSDDTAIRDVAIDGQPVQVRRRAQARVFVEVAGDPANDGQIACRRGLRLVLADGRILEDTVDICGDWKVTMDAAKTLRSQAGEGRAVRQAVPSGSGPLAPPRTGGVPRPVVGEGTAGAGLRGSSDTPPAAGADATMDSQTTDSQAPDSRAMDGQAMDGQAADIAAQEDRTAGDPPAPTALAGQDVAGGGTDAGVVPLVAGGTWQADPDGAEGWRLAYRLPQTGESALIAGCRAASGTVTLSLPGLAVAGAVNGAAPTQGAEITLSARDVTRQFPARGTAATGEAGRSDPVVDLSADDPVWTGLIRGEELAIARDGRWAVRLSLAGSAAPVRRFQQACARPQPQPAPALAAASRAPETGGVYADPVCADEGFVASLPDDRPARLVLRNDRRAPVDVFWLDFDGLRQFQARVPPGGRMEQDTLAGHPWLVAGPSGRCLAIYMASPGERRVVIGPGAAPGAAYGVAPAPLPDVGGGIAPDPFADLLRLSYACDNGRLLDVTIDNDRRVALVQEAGDGPVTLPDTSRGGGDFSYVGRDFALYGDGRTVTWEGRGGTRTVCRLL